MDRIIGWYYFTMENYRGLMRTICRKPGPGNVYLTSFFDGATQRGICGCGFWIRISKEQEYWVHWGVGRGTNMKAETIALWGLLYFATYLGIPSIHIFGDYLAIIDHIQGNFKINQPQLHGWLSRIGNIWAPSGTQRFNTLGGNTTRMRTRRLRWDYWMH